MSVLALARPELLELRGYSSARREAGAAATMLNANESPWPSGNGMALHRYPEPQPTELRRTMASLYGVACNQVLLCRGSGEGIDLLVRAFCRSGHDAILICPPTFGLYAVCAEVQGAARIEVPLDAGFKPDTKAILAAARHSVKLVFLASPNNPTGALVRRTCIDQLASGLAGNAVLVVDEAYIEFADSSSTCELLGRHENLVVLRSLSKAWALAGARVGAVVAHPQVVALLERIAAPYPLPAPSTAAVLSALDCTRRDEFSRRVARLVGERERLRGALEALAGVREVLHSDANFLCVRFDDADAELGKLARGGVVVRDVRAQHRLQDCLRISIGTPAENDRLLDALAAAQEFA